MNISFHHVQITVPSAHEAACRHFYGEVLGFREIPKPAILQKNGGAWFQVGNCELHVSIESPVGENSASKRHICYEVTDLAAMRAMLTRREIEIIEDQQPVPEWKRFYVRDPGGNRIEFAERR